MTVDFKNVTVFSDFKKTSSEQFDLREPLADLLYKNAAGVAGLECARKIYNSDGPVELNEREITLIKQVSECCTSRYYDAINNLFKELKKEEL